LQPIRYTFKGNDVRFVDPAVVSPPIPPGDPNPSSQHYQAALDVQEFVGLVAQDAEVQIPEMVSEETAMIDNVQETDYRVIDTGPLLYALVNAVKELAAGSGGAVLTKTVVVSSAEILALFTTPKELVAAPGANKILVPISITVSYKYNSITYTAGAGTFGVAYAGTAEIVPCGNPFLATASTIVSVAGAVDALFTDTVNKALVLKNATQNYATGDGTAIVTVVYRIENVA